MNKAISKNKEAEYKEALRKAKSKIEQLQAENAQLNSENEKCEIVVALGYSDIPIREKSRKPKEEIIKYI